MFTLILLVIIGLGFGLFATQNTQHITLTLANSPVSDIPLYIVIGITLLLGFAVCWVISLSDTFSSFLKMKSKDSKIKDSKKNITDLTKKVNELEVENARLQGELKRA